MQPKEHRKRFKKEICFCRVSRRGRVSTTLQQCLACISPLMQVFCSTNSMQASLRVVPLIARHVSLILPPLLHSWTGHDRRAPTKRLKAGTNEGRQMTKGDGIEYKRLGEYKGTSDSRKR